MRRAALVLLTVLTMSASPGVYAQDGNAAPVTPLPDTAPNLSTPENQTLSCLANGQAYTPGEVACVPGCHGRQRLARCDALAAKADWTTLSDSCPSARMTPLPPGNPAHPTLLACVMMPYAPFAQIQ